MDSAKNQGLGAGSRHAKIEQQRSDPGRLRALLRTGLVDARPTAALDRLTHLAATLIDVPAAFLSLVDADRDFYLSQCGFAEPLATSRELQGTTFCHYAMVNNGPLVIDDTRADPVFRQVPTVESLGVAAYLGVPIRSAEGEVIGSFCAIDFKPRAWTARDRLLMEELAASAMREIGLLQAIETHVREADEAQVARLAAEVESTTRREVLNAVAHDLRDPLNAILLALGPLEVPDIDDTRLAQSVAIVRRQAARMTRLLEDLLDAARIEAGALPIELQPVDMRELLVEVAADFAMQAEAAGVAIDVDIPPGLPAFQGDRARLVQAFSNLISNALKFTPRGGRARLAAQHEGEVLRLQVSDSGCGIEGPLLEKVFDPFWQANPAQRNGSGLGLHIVRGITESHGGVIRVRSSQGAGATFEIDLPLDMSPGASRRSPPGNGSAADFLAL